MSKPTSSLFKMFNSSKQNRLPPISNQLLLLPAHKLAASIKDGSLSSVKLCELYVERIRQVNPFINAVAQDRFKEAIEDARRIDDLLAAFRSGKQEAEFTNDELEMLRSPLLGLPISIKESVRVKGMKNSCGMWQRRDVVSPYDSVAVKNVRRWGMIPLCTTNIPECTLYWADCQNKVYGRSANPYDLNRITGASSGGEGSLIGAGGSLIGIGSDIGGSLRIPAHFCGIFAHKPSPFLVSSEGNFPELKDHRLRMFTLGPMSRYASDLRPLLKCLMSDKDNEKQDTYFKFQPKDISQIRKNLIHKLDEPVDYSQLKFYTFNYKDSQLKGKQALNVNAELLDAQQEVIDHFRSKFNCQVDTLNPDPYMKKAMITWECLLAGGGTVDRETAFEENELRKTFGIDNLTLEVLKMPFGLSKHTKESLAIIMLGFRIPAEREKAYPLCEKFEKLNEELRKELLDVLGDNGVLILPSLPSVAYKFHVSLTKTTDMRFPAIFNNLQMPVTHATMRLDKKHKLPFGISIAAKPFSDHLCLAVAEEIEQTFGGWVQPTTSKSAVASSVAPDEKQQSARMVEGVAVAT